MTADPAPSEPETAEPEAASSELVGRYEAVSNRLTAYAAILAACLPEAGQEWKGRGEDVERMIGVMAEAVVRLSQDDLGMVDMAEPS